MPPRDPLQQAGTTMQSPPTPSLREQAAMRAATPKRDDLTGSALSQNSPSMTEVTISPPTHESFGFASTPTTPHRQSSHPLSNSFLQPHETSESLAHSARKDWQRHGQGKTQMLEEKRQMMSRQPGTLNVRVLSAETRRDVSGAKYTAYILRVKLVNGEVIELEHRYSEFAKLRNVLAAHSIQMPCAFPEKHWAGRLGQWTPSLKWAPNQHEDLVMYRKVQLDVWLVHVVEQYNLGAFPHRLHQAVYDFLTNSDRSPCDQENLIRPTESASESWTRWNNPFSFTMGSTIRQATSTLEHMFPVPSSPTTSVWKESDQSIPLDLLHHAKGLCFLTVLKAGLVVSGRVGTGLLIARIDKDQWTAPCALGTVGMGWGMLAGGDITHYLVVLTTTEAVDALLGGTVQLGAELGVAVGPVGRGATSQVAAGDWRVHPAYSYAHSQGFFMGMSLEGSVLTTRGDVNAKFYGQHLPASQILDLPPPKAAQPLYQALKRALALEIAEDAFRPSQLFQDKAQYYKRQRPPPLVSSLAETQVDPSGRVTVPSVSSTATSPSTSFSPSPK